MIKIKWKPSPKQLEAFQILNDKVTTEILYGGGAGGGKSHLGCAWIIICALRYPGSRWVIGRAILKTLKESTLLTFFRICKDWGLKNGEDYRYNSIEAVVRFPKSGSEVYLKDLFAYPSDPEFDELGSTEFTGGFIDEASQITPKAYQIIMSRIRYKLDEFGLIPKLLTCTNPTKNFLYADFYKTWKEKQLPKYRRFVAALVQDNPYISHHYIENLGKLDRVSKERLLYGNWEYDDDPTRLFDYDSLLSMFDIPYTVTHREQKYITCDVARFGDDKTVIMLWDNLFVRKIWVKEKATPKESKEAIQELQAKENIPWANVVIDDDGVGGAGIVDYLPGCRGFVNNAKQLEPTITATNRPNYANLKSQCYFLLSEYVNTGRIGITKDVSITAKKYIIEDLEQIKKHDADKDSRIRVTPKEDIKEMIGRSTDFGDAMMMRMLFLLKKPVRPYWSK